MWNDKSPLFQYHIDYFHCPNNQVRRPYSVDPNLLTNLLLTVFKVLLFLECHIIGIMYYIDFLPGFFLLSAFKCTFHFIWYFIIF